MSFFLSSAYAADGATAATGSPMGSILMLVGFVVIFYFLLWRPQSKRAKAHKELVSGLSKGDEVITTGGMMGKIAQVDETFVMLSIADNVDIKIQKASVSTVLPKGSLKAAE